MSICDYSSTILYYWLWLVFSIISDCSPLQEKYIPEITSIYLILRALFQGGQNPHAMVSVPRADEAESCTRSKPMLVHRAKVQFIPWTHLLFFIGNTF